MPDFAMPQAWQRRALERAVSQLQGDAQVRAICLVGSIAHGFADDDADVDLLVVVTDEEMRRRRDAGAIAIWESDWTDHPWSGVDLKFSDLGFLQNVAERGNEASRWAFDGAQVVEGSSIITKELLERITRYPEEGLDARLARFAAQLEAAAWFTGEGNRKNNEYLRRFGAMRAVLFASRLVLAENRRLFPYHKWMLRAVREAPDKPRGIEALLDDVVRHAACEAVTRLHETLKNWRAWPDVPGGWGAAFMQDVEQVWLEREPAIEDL